MHPKPTKQAVCPPVFFVTRLALQLTLRNALLFDDYPVRKWSQKPYQIVKLYQTMTTNRHDCSTHRVDGAALRTPLQKLCFQEVRVRPAEKCLRTLGDESPPLRPRRRPRSLKE
ncbi:hypothetical protein EVAR_82234_1 [Eumeta japonica]|uniref:Uncharacterized protein n=1 Tax=Eumeta variegata TaxID=151549 RepID=A0A4C1W0X3_EUMVA|nr:hypothetical protein EVAR_82234_1 [Eumeta japonica]